MANGNTTVNGITDADLIKILEVKEKLSLNDITFNPQALQPIPGQPGAQLKPQQYNNANFAWNTAAGLAAVIEILKHIHAKPAGA